MVVVPLERIPPRDSGSGRVHVIVDTPAGSRNKYKYDPELKAFRLGRILPQGAVFPHDFGFIPGTRAPDGDPLDVMVLGLAPAFPGCVITARLLGVIRARQVEHRRSIRNDRLIAAAETPVNPSTFAKGLRSLSEVQLRAMEHFFESYNSFQGREFSVTGRGNARAAAAIVAQGIRSFDRKKNQG